MANNIKSLMGRSPKISLLIFMGVWIPQMLFPLTYYVKVGGSDLNTGLTWMQSFQSVQKAISVSTSGDSIWVAQGFYYPDEGPGVIDNNRSESFKLKAGVSIYGGFVGGETQLSQRNILANMTVLSGEIQQDDDPTNNSYHVVYSGVGVGINTKLNGFIIMAGNSADILSDVPNGVGAGIRIVNSSPKITLCHFIGNGANRGGGMAMDSMAMPEIAFCKFSFDSATIFGGAVFNQSSTPSFTSCIFQGNGVDHISGGAVYNSNSPSHFINCLFSGNIANTGAGIFNESSDILIVNCSFSGNRTTIGGGGAMYNQESSPNIFNTIIWNNQAQGVTNSVRSVTFNFSNSDPSFNHCLLSSAFDVNGVWQTDLGLDGGDNLMMDPLFVASLDPGLAPDTVGNFRLEECSPGINIGDNSINLTALDAALNARTNEGVIDLGAYELLTFLTNTWNALGDGIHWSDPLNWINEMVPTPCEHVMIPDGSTVILGGLSQGFGKTLQVALNADLLVDQTAELSILNP